GYYNVVDNLDTNNSVAGITSLSLSAISFWLPLNQIPPLAWRSQKPLTRALVLKYQKSRNEFWMQVVMSPVNPNALLLAYTHFNSIGYKQTSHIVLIVNNVPQNSKSYVSQFKNTLI
ncbi:MAG: hypothetical protein WA151_12565, partial [Desulfatirhabdiaceae bacterium]